MDAISSVSAPGGAESSKDIALLKKSQDLAAQQSAQLLEALPEPPRPPSPPGVGGNLDIMA
jgi:hypothetical protein